LPVADIRLGSRVAFSRCMITGSTAGEPIAPEQREKPFQYTHEFLPAAISTDLVLAQLADAPGIAKAV
jgi:hypothetical protein